MTTTRGERLRGHRGPGGLVADTTGQSREDIMQTSGELVEGPSLPSLYPPEEQDCWLFKDKP